MNKNSDEQLSAFMDGEATVQEWSPLLARMKDDVELRERWSRYHLIRDALQNNLPRDVRHDLRARVWSALDDEPAVVAPKRRVSLSSPWLKQVVGVAVAASVTAVAILGFQALNGTPDTPAAGTNLAAVPQSAPLAPQAEPASADLTLDPYLVGHEQAASTKAYGVLPYARLVSHGAVEE